MSKKPKEPEKENSERWLVTYADLMNLLLILFIILFAMSQVDKQKAEAVAESVREGFGYVEDGGTGEKIGSGSGLYAEDYTAAEGDPSADSMTEAASASDDLYWSQEALAFQKFYDEVEKLLQENHLEDLVDVKLDDRGIVISFKDNVLFTSGQAALSTSALDLIDSIGKMLIDLKFTYILVEGHTDSDPIHTSEYEDNMDLSTQRASNVWRELVACGLSPGKMGALGHGEFDPIAENDTPENKALNRRVTITILRSEVTSTDQAVINAINDQN